MPRYIAQFCVALTFLCGSGHRALAVQWQALSGTARYKVAYDEQSIRLTHQGRLAMWLRFVPRGEVERKLAAVTYKEKRYRSHLEYYELDCGEQTALLGLIDILGTSGVRLKRLPGGTQTDPILPGSLLESAAQRICPVPDEEPEEGSDGGDSGKQEEQDRTGDKEPDSDKRHLIEKLEKEASSKEAGAKTWRELGNAYFDTDQPEQAIKAYERALALQPDDADTLNDQGAMFRQTGDFQRAVTNFEKAVTIDPHNLESLYNSGYVYAFDLNDIPKALALWQRYLQLESTGDRARQVQSFIERYGK